MTKRLRTFLFLVFLLCFWLRAHASDTFTETIFEAEPNDSTSGPQKISIPSVLQGIAFENQNSDLTLITDTDLEMKIQDVYEFSVEDEKEILITLESLNADSDLDIALFEGDLKKIIKFSAKLSPSNEKIKTKLKSGKYFVGISSFRGNSEYILKIKDTEEDFLNLDEKTGFYEIIESEPNNFLRDAQDLKLPAYLSGSINENESGQVEIITKLEEKFQVQDLYKIRVENTNLLINLKPLSNANHFGIILLSHDGKKIIKISENVLNETVIPQEYLIGVISYKGSGEYKLTVKADGNKNLKINGPENLDLSKENKFNYTVIGDNFISKRYCNVTYSSGLPVKIIPRRFVLEKGYNLKNIKLFILKKLSNPVQNHSLTQILINIDCKDGIEGAKRVLIKEE